MISELLRRALPIFLGTAFAYKTNVHPCHAMDIPDEKQAEVGGPENVTQFSIFCYESLWHFESDSPDPALLIAEQNKQTDATHYVRNTKEHKEH